jgi:predicted phosphodiesterase
MMRALIISDIHANRTALEAVLNSVREVDQVWCLGDIVGYGPDPNECIDLLRNLPNLVCVLGNHDAAVCNQIPHEVFNLEARNAIYWTHTTLLETNLQWLCRLPDKVEVEGFTLVHGSPRNPVWEYLLDPNIASVNFNYFNTDSCFVGHTHLPIIYKMVDSKHPAQWTIPHPNQSVALTGRQIINPGSVGQPRDRDPRASFGILDIGSRTWMPLRASYDIQEVQERILSASLPERHAVRLLEGW